ncbi:adenylate cyclase [Mesorhizobium sp. 113-3-3]|nr:adenylate cyclase [Mesorhizobium sp. 113-3-3]
MVSPERTQTWRISHSLTGEAVNLASRIQGLAGADAVLASHETVEVLEGGFETQPIGARRLKGFSRAIHVSEIKGPKMAADRSSARFQRGSTRIIGRGAELDMIQEAWRNVQVYQSQSTLFIYGEAGVGKSRLVEEFRKSSDTADATYVKLNCSEIAAAIPLHPIVGFLRSSAGAMQTDSAANVSDKTDKFLKQFGIEGDVERHVMRSLLGLESVDQARLGSAQPRHRKKIEFGLLLGIFERLLGPAPCILFLDDVHWLDPSSREFIEILIERLKGRPLLVMLASRKKLEVSARERYPHSIDLEPLNFADSHEVLSWVPGTDQLGHHTTRQIVELSDGIPFYLEELAIAALEHRGHLATREPPKNVRRYEIPLLLAELLSERLDSVPSMQPLLRVMSAFGEPISVQILSLALGEPPDQIQAKLAALIHEGVVAVSGGSSEEVYDFRHALLNRVCYGGMVHAIRHESHRRIVSALLSNNTPPVAEVLAHHLTGAAMYEKAAEAWLKAGTEAARRSANVEAINSLSRALDAVGQIRDSPGYIPLELMVRASLVGPYVAVKGFCAPEVFECCSAGLSLCEKHPSPYVFPFLYARFTWEITTGHVHAALATAQAFLDLAAARNYQPGETIGNRLLGMALFANGQSKEAERALSSSILNYNPDVDNSVTYLFGANSKITGQALLSLVLFYSGRDHEAATLGIETLRHADELRHPLSTAIAIGYIGGFIAAYNGEVENVVSQSRRLVTFSAENSLRVFQIFGDFFLGWASFQSGRLASGLQLMSEALENLAAIGWKLSVPNMIAFYAEACVAVGKTSEAMQLCELAKTLVSEGETWGECEVLRVEALAMHHGQPEDSLAAERLIQRSVALARERLSPTFERRALKTAKLIFGRETIQDDAIEHRLLEIGNMGK